MEPYFPTSSARHVLGSNSSTIPVRHLDSLKILGYVVLAVGFEVVFETLSIILHRIKCWGDLIYIPRLVIVASIVFISGLDENYKAVSARQSASTPASPCVDGVDPSAILILKAEILPTMIAQAAYITFVEAVHSLPSRIWSWEDSKKTLKILLQCARTFVSVALQNYKTWLTTRNFPASTALVINNWQISATLEAFESNIFGALNNLPHDIPLWREMVTASQSLRQSNRLLGSRAGQLELVNQTRRFVLRLREVFCRPSEFAGIFLNFCSLVRSLWGGARSGPEAILPMSSPTKRPSSHLAGLLLRHSRELPQREFRMAVSLPESSRPWTVVAIDLTAVSPEVAKGTYSTGADVYGLSCLLFVVEIMNLLITPSWITLYFGLPNTIATLMFGPVAGDGTLALHPLSEGHYTSAPAHALLLDEEFNVVLRGNQNLVEAITLGGFYFSHPFTDTIQAPVWKAVVSLILEGFFQGLHCLMALVPLCRLVRPSLTSPSFQVIGTNYLVSSFMVITSWRSVQRALLRPTTDTGLLKKIAQCLAEAIAEYVRSTARAAPLVVSWFLYIHEYTVFNELQLIICLLSSLAAFFIPSVSSKNYPIRMAKFLDVLGNPPLRKWQFRTPAASATFQCLVLCHDIPRPVRDIDIRSVLDALIPDQRDVSRAWKARVADRIIHEVEISFIPTLPTFRSPRLQEQLKEHLDEAQYSYDTYRRWFKSAGFADK